MTLQSLSGVQGFEADVLKYDAKGNLKDTCCTSIHDNYAKGDIGDCYGGGRNFPAYLNQNPMMMFFQQMFQQIMQVFANIYANLTGNNAVEGNNNRTNGGIYSNKSQSGGQNAGGNSSGNIDGNENRVNNGNITNNNYYITKKCDHDHTDPKPPADDEVELTPELKDKIAENDSTRNKIVYDAIQEAAEQNPGVEGYLELRELAQDTIRERLDKFDEEFKAANPEYVKFMEKFEEKTAAMDEAIAKNMEDFIAGYPEPSKEDSQEYSNWVNAYYGYKEEAQANYLEENPDCKEYLNLYQEAMQEVLYY